MAVQDAARPSVVPQEATPPEGSAPRSTPRKPRPRQRGQRGSILRRGKKWVIIYRTQEGKQKWECGFTSKENAQTRLTNVLKAVRENTYVLVKDVLFEDFALAWHQRRQAKLKPSTWQTARSAIHKWLLGEFGFKGWRVRDIARRDVKEFGARLVGLGTLKGKTVREILTVLHGILQDAVDQEACAANPCHKLRLDIPDDSVERHVPSVQEFRAVLAELHRTPIYAGLLAAAALTGCRRGELCGLLWKEVDFQRHVLRIERSLVRIQQRKAGAHKNLEWICSASFACAPPKTKKGRRKIYMAEELERVLQGLWANRLDEKNPFVFQGLHGPLDLDNIQSVLDRAADRAKVRRFGLHGVRHLFASVFHESGATLAQARDTLGHTTTKMSSLYTHMLALPREKMAAVARDLLAPLPVEAAEPVLAENGLLLANRS